MRTPQRFRCVGEFGLGERDLAKRSAHASVEGQARRGRLRGACGATDEDDAELRFERRERPADRLQRPAEPSSSPGQVSAVDDRYEGLVVLELRAIGREFLHLTRGEYPTRDLAGRGGPGRMSRVSSDSSLRAAVRIGTGVQSECRLVS
jgi:hypothetical protein